jgi:DNA-binding PadR family transcriptional regulator
MARSARSNPLALAVLACLAEHPMHPYEMASTMRTRGHDESIRLNYGSLYTVVESLARRGLIQPRETVREGRRPERTVYAITDAGHAELVDWLTQLHGTPVKEFPQFEAGLALMGELPPDDVVALLEERRHGLEVEVSRIDAMVHVATHRDVPRVFLVELDFERGQRVAELDFVGTLIDGIASGTLDGVDQWRAFHDPDAPDAPTTLHAVLDPSSHPHREEHALP